MYSSNETASLLRLRMINAHDARQHAVWCIGTWRKSLISSEKSNNKTAERHNMRDMMLVKPAAGKHRSKWDIE